MALKLSFSFSVSLFIYSSSLTTVHCNTTTASSETQTAATAAAAAEAPTAAEAPAAAAAAAAAPAAAAPAAAAPAAAAPVRLSAFQSLLIKLEITFQRYRLPTTQMSAVDFKSRIRKVLLDFAEKFRVLLPPNEVLIRRGTYNDTFTHRFVYAPLGSRLEIPCTTLMQEFTPFKEFAWRRLGDRLEKNVEQRFRVREGNNASLVFETLDNKDSGDYDCVAKIDNITHRNIVEIRVFSLADVIVGFPLKFRASHCNKDEQMVVISQARRIFCPGSIVGCSLNFSITCTQIPWHDRRSTDVLPAVLEVLAMKHLTKQIQAPAKCDNLCLMNMKVQNSITEAIGYIDELVLLYETIAKTDLCDSTTCARDFVFLPEQTMTEIRLMYSCSPGYVLHRISTCVPCPPGRYAPLRGPNDVCLPCPPNTYQPKTGSDFCYECDEPSPRPFGNAAISYSVCHVDPKKRLSRILMVIAYFCGWTPIAILLLFCIVCRKRVQSIWKIGDPEDVVAAKGTPDEKEPLVSAPGGQTAAHTFDPQEPAATLPHPPADHPPGDVASVPPSWQSSALPSEAATGDTTTTATTATTVTQSHGGPATDSKGDSTYATTEVTATSDLNYATPITVSSNAQPVDIIKKAIDKVAPDMQLESLKIKTGDTTNVVRLPPNFFDSQKAASQPLTPTTAASTPTALSATSLPATSSFQPSHPTHSISSPPASAPVLTNRASTNTFVTTASMPVVR